MWALVAILVAIGLYGAAPWILPVRVLEGPMLQMTGPDAAVLVWYTTRPADCVVRLTAPDGQRTMGANAQGRRHRAWIGGLASDVAYTYQIEVSGRRLADPLTFRTSPGPQQRYSFLVFGDSGRGTRAQYRLAGEMAGLRPPPDFLVHTGDVVYEDGAREDYSERFFSPYQHLLPRINFWPCLGNHDLHDNGQAAAYREVFELPENGPAGLTPERNYWFDYANSRFAIVDSNLDEPTLRERVAPWLAEVLADTGPRWKFVVLHHPPFTGGQYQPDQRIQRALVPIIQAAGVDLVFSGHDHNYQRSYPLLDGRVVEPGRGVIYVVSGAGGASLYPARQPRPEFLAVIDDQHYSFTQVTIQGDELRLRQIALDGGTIDELTLRKSPVPATLPAGNDPTPPDLSQTPTGTQ